ncbi:uncharacterized protein LOC62_03G003908 [Vanrija pseudolonga]|uniref:BTB domain-containing protein n=1 Tax=Vanrija pseudolonga TaxID=143232 RepID=A0AAF0Y9D8_9TREE|nr:hypothetical protein LOC62_03G003908 [Vanrija pseudolonga]
MSDFTLISSDNIRFRVDSSFIFAASSVFRDARELGGDKGKTVDFTDNDIETADTLRLFLLLATTGKLPAELSCINFVLAAEKIAHLTSFLLKYSCEPTIQALKGAVYFDFLSPLLLGARDGVPGIILGSMTDDVDYCIQAMDAGIVIGTEPGDPIINCRHSEFDLVPYNLPYKVARFIPTDYMWALSYSWNGKQKDWPTKFRSLMRRVKDSQKRS